MTITFEYESDVIIYALEKVIAYARINQQIFVTQCVWWLASIIDLEPGLIIRIDNLRKRKYSAPLKEDSGLVHPDRERQILSERAVSSTPRDLTEDSRLDRVLEEAERCIATSKHTRNTWQCNRINPLPQTRKQLKKARKVKRLQEGNRKREVERNKRLLELRNQFITNLSKE
jgi:hypothetical protein